MKRDKQRMGSRYIEVFLSNSADLGKAKGRSRHGGNRAGYEEDRAGYGHSYGASRSHHHSHSPSPYHRDQGYSRDNRDSRAGPWVLRLRGVPFTANEDDVRRFLGDIVPGKGPSTIMECAFPVF